MSTDSAGGGMAAGHPAGDGWGTPWAEAVSGPLAGATCLWQDLDGLHVSAAPQDAPPTSILWGWREDGMLLRVRLDGDAAFIAELDGSAQGTASPGAVPTVAWDVAGDGRVAAVRGPGPELGGAGAVYEQIVDDGIEAEAGPVTFLRPAARPRG